MVYSPQQVQELITRKAQTFQLVDVREPAEYAEKHLPGALNIPLQQLASRIAELDRRKAIIFYCVSGGRSYNAIRKMRLLGYSNLGHVTLEDWERAGMKLARPGQEAGPLSDQGCTGC